MKEANNRQAPYLQGGLLLLVGTALALCNLEEDALDIGLQLQQHPLPQVDVEREGHIAGAGQCREVAGPGRPERSKEKSAPRQRHFKGLPQQIIIKSWFLRICTVFKHEAVWDNSK
eukprot:scaffold303879_cov43-Prasinocladus_malaysianus.AAC.1